MTKNHIFMLFKRWSRLIAPSFVLLISCAINSDETFNNRKNSHTPPDVQPSAEEMENRGSSKDESNSEPRDKAMLVHVNGLASSLKMGTLERKKVQPPHWELRLWNILGVDDEKVLVINDENGKFSAVLHSVINESGKPLKVRRQTLLPKDGWAAFSEYTKEQQINNELYFQLDPLDTLPIIDESVLFLEYKNSKGYKFAYFSQYTKSADGVRLLRICEEMERQFRVDLGCKPDS